MQINYTALSMVAPEKVHFRYMLEGQDSEWREVVNKREVQYSNLSPGKALRFRVAGEQQQWTVERRAMCSTSRSPRRTPDELVSGHSARSSSCTVVGRSPVAREAIAPSVRHDARGRVGERTRIARELHDTLLQGFHGPAAAIPDCVVLLPERPAEAKDKLDTAIAHAAKAITEGRDAVQGLRASTVERNDLAVAIRTMATSSPATRAHQPPTFSVAVEGQTRDLHPIVRDEIYKIAAEALRNAFRHAHAGRSRSTSATTTSNSDCACATMVSGSMRRCSQTRGSGTLRAARHAQNVRH